MRMIDRTPALDRLATQRPLPGLAARARHGIARLTRAWSNRRAIRRLNELTDRELLDLGLRRGDVAEAAASFFSDAGLHLTLAARERARRHLRQGYPD
ncbi:DUF1127 domain-containing protein [Shinella daejeonensis]|nr:DUF1127 domain-containing protein [Shinella daejeonensis]